jgi:hypothetical protein
MMNLPIEIINEILCYAVDRYNVISFLTLNKEINKYFTKYYRKLIRIDMDAIYDLVLKRDTIRFIEYPWEYIGSKQDKIKYRRLIDASHRFILVNKNDKILKESSEYIDDVIHPMYDVRSGLFGTDIAYKTNINRRGIILAMIYMIKGGMIKNMKDIEKYNYNLSICRMPIFLYEISMMYELFDIADELYNTNFMFKHMINSHTEWIIKNCSEKTNKHLYITDKMDPDIICKNDNITNYHYLKYYRKFYDLCKFIDKIKSLIKYYCKEKPSEVIYNYLVDNQ